MAEVRAKHAVGVRAAHRVATAAMRREVFETGPLATARRPLWRLELMPAPGCERFRRLRHDQQTHLRVLNAAIFRALSAIDSGLAGLKPGFIGLPRDSVCLSAQRGNPE